MKKRVLLAVAAMVLLIAVGLTGCGGTTVADPSESSSAAESASSMALSDVTEDNLNGMITYLRGNVQLIMFHELQHSSSSTAWTESLSFPADK